MCYNYSVDRVMNHGRTYAAISIFLTMLLMTIATSTTALASQTSLCTLKQQNLAQSSLKNNHDQYQLIFIKIPTQKPRFLIAHHDLLAKCKQLNLSPTGIKG